MQGGVLKPSRVITATLFAMIATQTVGSVDAKHRLPSPRQYVAITVLWGILLLMADTGLGKLAARLSTLILLTGMVLGPFGSTAVGFLNTIRDQFAIPPEGPPTGSDRQPAEEPQQTRTQRPRLA